MNNIKSQLKFQFYVNKATLIIYGLIMAILLIGLVLVNVINGVDGEILVVYYSDLVTKLWLIGVSMFSISSYMPYALSLGFTRKDYYSGVVVYNIILSAFLSVMVTIAAIVEKTILGFLGLNQKNYYYLLNNKLDFIGFLFLIVCSFSMMIVIAAFFNFISALYYRLGRVIFINLISIILIIFLIPTILFSVIFGAEGFNVFSCTNIIKGSGLLAFAILNFVLAWLLIKRADIKSN